MIKDKKKSMRTVRQIAKPCKGSASPFYIGTHRSVRFRRASPQTAARTQTPHHPGTAARSPPGSSAHPC